MKYHIFVSDEQRITIDDDQEHTDGLCVTLVDGEILHEEDDDQRLDAPRMDATFAEVIAKHDLSDPEQRAYLRRTFEDTKAHAEATLTHSQGKLTDHGVMLMLSNKYLAVINEAEVEPEDEADEEVDPRALYAFLAGVPHEQFDEDDSEDWDDEPS